MSSSSPLEVIRVCQQCGAEFASDATQCWLCKAQVSEPQQVVVANLVAPPEAPVWKLSEMFFAVLSALTALMIVLIGIGVFVEEFAAGVVYVIVVLPPLAVTVARTYRKTRSGAGISWAERFATFVVSAVVMAGILGLLAVAALAFLIIMCFMNPPHFH